ncbi:MAG: heavy metal-associated domain-containing protein [Vicinamibacterales bacterium]
MLIGSLRQARMTKQTSEESAVATTTLAIGGMTCGTCERHVLRALEGLRGVIQVAVYLQDAQTMVEHLPALVDALSLVTAVRNAGYEARVIQTMVGPDSVANTPRKVTGATRGCACCDRSERSGDRATPGTRTID